MTSDELILHFIGRMGKLDARVRAVFDRMGDDAINRPIPPSQWSPLQILDHLMRSNGPYLQVLRLVKLPAGGGAPVKHSFMGRMVMRAAGPGGNAPAPPAMRPSAGPHERGLIDQYLAQTAQLVDIVRSFEGKALDTTRITSPFAKFMKFNLADVLAITLEHTERHVGQIEAALSETTQK